MARVSQHTKTSLSLVLTILRTRRHIVGVRSNAFAQHRKGFPHISEATAVPNSASMPLASSSTTSAAACSNKQRDSTIARQRLLPLPLQRHGRLSRARAPLLKPARRFSRLKLACEKRVRAQKHRAPSLDLPQRHHHHRQVATSATALECSHNPLVSRRRAQQTSRMLRAAARVDFQVHRYRRLDAPTSREAASPSDQPVRVSQGKLVSD